MPRVARLDMPGVLYHVIVRGVERRQIFIDDQDRKQFLDRLSYLLQQTETLCYAWSLMTSHFHLLLYPTRFKLAVLMRRLLTGYAITFNLIHHRTGHLFQNRYQSILCDKEAYLLELIRYIYLNPLKAGIVDTLQNLERYPWSGHGVLMGHRNLEGQTVDEVLRRFGVNVSDARQRYRDFIADGLRIEYGENLADGVPYKRALKQIEGEEIEKGDNRILGDRFFADKILENRALHEKGRIAFPLRELVDKVSSLLGLAPDAVRRPGKSQPIAEARGILCYVAIRDLGYKGFELGRELNLGPAGVSIAMRRGETILKEKPAIKEMILSRANK